MLGLLNIKQIFIIGERKVQAVAAELKECFR